MKKVLLVILSLSIVLSGSIMAQAAKTVEGVNTSIAVAENDILIVNAKNELWAYSSPIATYGLLLPEEQSEDYKSLIKKGNRFIKLMNNVSQVFTFDASILVLKTNGTLWSLFRDSIAFKYPPVLLDTDVKTVSSNGKVVVYMKSDNTLWEFNGDDLWDMHIGDLSEQELESMKPKKIADDVIQASPAGISGVLFIKSDYSLWGRDVLYSEKREIESLETPTKIMDDVRYAVASRLSSLYFAVKKDGSLWSWGVSGCGELGNGGKYDLRRGFAIMDSNYSVSLYKFKPEKIMDNVKMVFPVEREVYAITEDSEVWVWGNSRSMEVNKDWEILQDLEYEKTVPRKVSGEYKDIVGIKVEYPYNNTVIVKKDGTVWAKAKLEYGLVGISTEYQELSREFYSGELDIDSFYSAYARDISLDKVELVKIMDGGVAGQFPEIENSSSRDSAMDKPWTNPFKDVKKGDWFYEAVKFAHQSGLFFGTGADTFSPNSLMTREMFWMVMSRWDGQSFSGNKAFEAARFWAFGNGISDGSDPHGNITREQLVTMLWRYAGFPKSTGGLDMFSDAGSVDPNAVKAMTWAVESGIIVGSNGELMPKGFATRAQVAKILQKFADCQCQRDGSFDIVPMTH